MSTTFLLLIAASLSVQQTPAPAEPTFLRGEVLDKFDGERILLSFGSEQGVRKGLRGTIIRTKATQHLGFSLPRRPDSPESLPAIDPSPFAAQWVIEFVEVGAKHSVAKRIADERMTPWDFRFPEHDPIAWLKAFPWEIRAEFERQLKEHSAISARPIEYSDLLPRFQMFGGAVIDLARPAEIRVPRK
jgi:hypothetical protein